MDIKDIDPAKYMCHLISGNVGTIGGAIKKIEQVLEEQMEEALKLKVNEKSRFDVNGYIDMIKRAKKDLVEAIEIAQFFDPKENIFDLYTSHGPRAIWEATKYIKSSIEMGYLTLDTLHDDLLEKYRYLGATDTASRDQIYLYLKGEHECQK